jgi:hypothetical protein
MGNVRPPAAQLIEIVTVMALTTNSARQEINACCRTLLPPVPQKISASNPDFGAHHRCDATDVHFCTQANRSQVTTRNPL